MYAAIRRYRLDSDKRSEVTRHITQEFVSHIRESQGLLGYYVPDVGDGRFARLSICETQAELEMTNRMATDWIKQFLASRILS